MGGGEFEKDTAAGAGESALRAHLLRYVERRMDAAARRWTEPQDIVQQVLVELGERRAQGVSGPGIPLDPEPLRAWVCKRADWRLANLHRDHAHLRGETALPAAGQISQPTPSLTDGTVTRADTRHVLSELVRHLPAEYGEAVRLCALEGKSFVAAGQALGVSADTVRKRYARARSVLGRALAARRHD